MSHLATVDIEVRDLDALQEACQRVGVELVRDQKKFRNFAGRMDDCLHAIRVPGDEKAYEMGLIKREDGRPGFDITTDWWAGGKGLFTKVGIGARLLKQAYATVVAKREAIRQGFRVQEIPGKNGSIQLRMTKA
jgi:hypothetical protein